MDDPKRVLWLERAERLRHLRDMLKITRRAFCEKIGIPSATVTYWETVSSDSPGLEERGAKRIARAVESIGCKVTPEWLLTGNGAPPYLLRYKVPNPLNHLSEDKTPEDIEVMARDIVARWGDNYVWHRVDDEAMLPYVSQGDVLVAIKVPVSCWHDTFGYSHIPALIRLNDGATLVRFLHCADKDKIALFPANIRASLAVNKNLWVSTSDIVFAASIACHFQYGVRKTIE